MRLFLVPAAIAVLALSSGCGHKPRTLTDDPTVVEVYDQVLTKYLTTPSHNSFPGIRFKTVYVLDRADPGPGTPRSTRDAGVPITKGVQDQLTAELKDLASVEFIADGNSVLDNRDTCATVRNGGILITLGTVEGDDTEVNVGIGGYVACLGATRLTYVVHNEKGTGWMVTGTTGTMAVS